MIRFLNKNVFSWLLFLLLFSSACFGLDVDPGRFELTLEAGTKKDVAVSLFNRCDEIMVITAQAGQYRFLLSENSSPPAGKTPSECLNSCEKWISFELDNFILNPGEKRDFKFTITTPAGAQGEYAACLLLDQAGAVDVNKNDNMESENDAIDVNLELVYRRAIPVYIFIKDTVEINAEITGISIKNMLTKEIIEDNFTANRIKFEVTLKNTGTKHIRSKGNIVILDNDGNLIESVPTGKTLPVFPGFSETIPVFWEPPLKENTYTAVITIDLGDDKILQGEKHFSINKEGFLIK